MNREVRNARARDNQRLSRARRAEYIASLEKRIHDFEKGGVAATQQMQNTARTIEKQNSQLRSWLCRYSGLREQDVSEWLRHPSDTAEEFFELFLNAKKSVSSSRDDSRVAQMNDYDMSRQPSRARWAQDRIVFASRNTSIPEQQAVHEPLTPHSVADVEVANFGQNQARYDAQMRSMSMPQLQSQSMNKEWRTQMMEENYPSRHMSINYPHSVPANYEINQQWVQPRPSSSDYSQQMSPSTGMPPSQEGLFNSNMQSMSAAQAAYLSSNEPTATYNGSARWISASSPSLVTAPAPAQVPPDPVYTQSLQSDDSIAAPRCGQGMSSQGQYYCNTLNKSSSAENDSRLRSTCRQSYDGLKPVMEEGSLSFQDPVGESRDSGGTRDQHENVAYSEAVMRMLEQNGNYDV